MEVLHLDYCPGTADWVLPLQTRLNESASSVLRTRYADWAKFGFAELGMAVATRFSLTLRVAYRLSELLKSLRDEINDSGQIDELLRGGFVFSPKDHRILYDICVAIDAFYFEYRSSYEVVGRFVTTFCKEILDKTITEKALLDVLREAKVNIEWIELLRDNRKLFFHQTAPWIALEIHQHHPLECSLLVMKENIHEFHDPTTYVTQQQITDTVV
jgi:hypothetical protein